MSRIILSRYDDGSDHIVVGFDRPLNTYYWQEFNQEPEDWSTVDEETWDEMIGFAGYDMNEIPTTQDLVNHAATHSEEVFRTILVVVENSMGSDIELLVELKRHKTLDYPESNITLDLSERSK